MSRTDSRSYRKTTEVQTHEPWTGARNDPTNWIILRITTPLKGSHDLGSQAISPLALLRRGNVSDLAQVDPAGRAWVVSNRPARDGSLVEAFEGGAHIGAVQLPGRVLAIHVLDTLLAALTEDAAIGTDGLYPRRLAWYRLPDTLGGLAQRE